MDELQKLHLRLVNALLAIVVVVLPLVSYYWPGRVPPVAAAAICVLFLGTGVLHSLGKVTTARAAQVLIITMGMLALASSMLHLLRHPDPATAFANETYNSVRALVLLTGGAYVTLGRRRGRRAAVAALAIWIVVNLTVIQTLGLLEMVSAPVLIPILDVIVSTSLAALLFDVAAMNARHLERGRRTARRLAAVDELTGVKNRHGVVPAMEEALDAPGSAALIVLDLDHFKRINDTQGHAGGDEILRQVGRALNRVARSGDAVGRWGGEEFVVVLEAGGEGAAVRVAKQLKAAIHDIRADFPVSASFGVTVVQSADTVESLFKRADGALYTAKNGGRDRIVTTWDGADVTDLTVEAARQAEAMERANLLEASRDRTRRN